jgi:hypothetical protein
MTMNQINEYRDEIRLCLECGAKFLHSSRDQIYYAERGFTAPKRCRACREKKKLERDLDAWR